MTDRTIKTKCPVGLEEITIEILDPDELILTRKRGPDGKYRQVPRKETKYPKYEVSCPSCARAFSSYVKMNVLVHSCYPSIWLDITLADFAFGNE